MEDIFGERKVFIDGEELIEVVDTYPKGKMFIYQPLQEFNYMNSDYLINIDQSILLDFFNPS